MPRPTVIFVVFVIAYFLSYFYRSANAVIADDLMRDLLLTPAQLGLMTSLFYMVFAAIQLPLGAALDRYGSRWTTPALMLLGALGSLIFALAQSFEVLAVGRALIGLGMAGVLMGALKAFSGWFPAERFATVAGLFLALGASGALSAATPLALMNAHMGWRPVFAYGAVLVTLSAVAIMVFARNAPTETQAKHSGQRDGFAQVFKDLRFWRIALLGFAITGSMFAYQGLWAGPYLRESLGRSEIEVGNLLLVMSACVIAGYLLAGWLADRFGLSRVMVAGAVVYTAVQFVLALAQPAWPNWSIAGFVGVFGFLGAFNLLLLAQIRAIFPLSLTGRAITAVNLFGIGGSALLQWWLGLIVNVFPQTAQGATVALAYTTIFAVTGMLCLATLLFYLPLARKA